MEHDGIADKSSFGMNLPGAQIEKSLAAYGFLPSTDQCDLIRRYIALLLRWNRQIALTAVIDPIEVLQFHFGESFYAMSAGMVKDGRLADVGSGAGFPGLPLAIANEALQVTLIEPNLKKSVFLAEVKRELELPNVQIARIRMEDFQNQQMEYISCRAVGRFDALLSFARTSLKEGGRVVLWVGEADRDQIVRTHADWTWSQPMAIPKSKRRYLLSGSPM